MSLSIALRILELTVFSLYTATVLVIEAGPLYDEQTMDADIGLRSLIQSIVTSKNLGYWYPDYKHRRNIPSHTPALLRKD
jgi:hypothetical protein